MASEFELIAALTAALHPGDAVVGPGDDAAVVALGAGLHVLSSDLIVEDVDFRRRWASARDIGFKAAAVTLSDVAAMGARPAYLTVDVGTPEGSVELFAELGAGLQEACAPHGCSIVGGDVSRAPVLLLSTSALGRVKGRPVLRSGALPGDLVLVTGTLGDAAAGLALLEAGRQEHPELRGRALRPQPRVEAGLRIGELGLASAMIDISDGLLQDLGHVCRRSDVEALVWLEDLPLSRHLGHFCRETARDPFELAATGGEDFELLFTAPQGKLFRIQDALAELVAVHVIGEVQPAAAGPAVRLSLDGRDVTADLPWAGRSPGWDHFRGDDTRAL